MSDCPLCRCEAFDAGHVPDRLLDDYWPEDGHPDYLGLKRELESEFGLSVTLSGLKQHDRDHVTYQFDVGRLDESFEPSHAEGGGS